MEENLTSADLLSYAANEAWVDLVSLVNVSCLSVEGIYASQLLKLLALKMALFVRQLCYNYYLILNCDILFSIYRTGKLGKIGEC